MPGIKENVQNALEMVTGLPDKVQDPAKKKWANLAFATAIIVLGAGLMASLSFSGFSGGVPNATLLIGLAMPMAMLSAGIWFFLDSIVPKRHHKTLRNTMAIAAVFFIAAAGAFIFGYAFTNSYPNLTNLMANPMTYLGVGVMGAGPLFLLGCIPQEDDDEMFTAESPEYIEMCEKERYDEHLRLKQLQNPNNP